MGPDRLALISAGHHGRADADAEMIRPEPDQPLHKTDLGADGGIDASAGFLQEDPLLQRRRSLFLAHLLCGLRLHRGLCHARVLVTLLLGELLLSEPFGVVLEHRSIGSAAGLQIRIVYVSCARPIKLREQRATRIGCDRRDRAGARPKSESMQRQGCTLWIGSHDFACLQRMSGNHSCPRQPSTYQI
jgi:hypothetical protein